MPVKLDLEIIKGSSFARTFTKYSEDYLNYRGAWSKLTQYEVDDVVTFKNVVYKCVLDTTASQLPTNGTYYDTPDGYDYSLCTFEAKIRENYDEAAAAIAFTVAFPGTGGTDGKFQISLNAEQTAALDFKTGVYDIEITLGTQVWKEARGTVTIIDEATK